VREIYLTPNGVARFRPNEIVLWLLENGNKTMNDIAIQDFSDEDRMEFAQLVGYSASGYGDLSYVSTRSMRAADKKAAALVAEQ
jgi:hypothetical protein